MVTIKDMAEMAGVAPTTVSNVLHGRTKKMSKETLARVQKVIDECQYVTNMGARLLANYGSRIIGVIISYGRREEQNAIQDPFFSEVIGALEKEIRLNGYFMMLYTSGNVEESLKIASSWNIEGLVVLGDADCGDFYRLGGGYAPGPTQALARRLSAWDFQWALPGHSGPESKEGELAYLAAQAGSGRPVQKEGAAAETLGGVC